MHIHDEPFYAESARKEGRKSSNYFLLEALMDFFNADSKLNGGFLRAHLCRILIRAASFFMVARERRKLPSEPFKYDSITTG